MYDVVIVGGGPAGAMFARELAAKDPQRNILLIDGQNEQRRKVCGGLLAPDAQKVLAKLDLTLPNSVLADPQIFSVETMDLCSGDTRYYQRHYLNMDRLAFDRWLLSLIPDNVKIKSGRCIAIDEKADCFTLKIKSEDDISQIEARIIVGADGASSIVRRHFFGVKMLQYVAIQEWYPQEDPGVPAYSCIFDESTSDSCSWTIRKDGCMIFGGAFRQSGCREAFEEQKKHLEEKLGCSLGEPIKREACLLSSPRRMRDFIVGKPGVYLVGEAAGFVSASSFEGISSAFLSGRALADACLNGKNAEEILRFYRKNTASLRWKLYWKTIKRWVLCTPILRRMIMKSGIQSVK